MKKILKWLILSVGTIVVLFVLGIGALIWVAKSNTDDVKSICKIQMGTSVEQVMKNARNLGFSESAPGALGPGFVVFVDDQETSIEWNDDTLPGLKNGRIQVGKISIPPFLRNYCELTFKDRKVTNTRTWTLD